MNSSPLQTVSLALMVFITPRLGQGASAIVEFAYSPYFVSESDGAAVIEVQRSGDTNAVISVDYSTTDGTAHAGVDYVAVSGTLTFGAGAVSTNFAVPIIDNGLLDGTRKLNLILSNPMGATLGVQSTLTLLISDDEQPVMVDPSFRVSTDGGVDSAAVYPDGRLIICGDFSTVGGLARCGLARLYDDGTLDPTFDAGSAFPRCWSRIEPFALGFQTDGKILVSGIEEVAIAKTVRLQPDGATDTTFKSDRVAQFFPQPDGTFLAFDGGNLQQLNSDGTWRSNIAFNLPLCWGRIDRPPLGTYGFSFALQPDGKFLMGGDVSTCSGGSNHVALLRFNPDGSSDFTFQAPVLDGDAEQMIQMIFVETDGHIIIGGGFRSVNGVPRLNVARLSSNGSLDPNFYTDPDSVPTVPPVRVGYQYSFAYSGALQPDGKVIMSFLNGEFGPQRLLRFNEDGSVDPTFRCPASQVLGVQPDDKIIVAGRYGPPIRLFDKTEGLTGFTLSPDGDFTAPADYYYASPAPTLVATHGRTLRVYVYRLGPTTNTASVDFATLDGSATAGVDYMGQSGTLSFRPLERVKPVSISLLGNSDLRTEKTFSLILTQASQGSMLGMIRDTTLTIVPELSVAMSYEGASTDALVRVTLTPTTPGIWYRLVGSANPNFWSPRVYTDKLASGSSIEFDEVAAGAQRFYRAVRLGP